MSALATEAEEWDAIAEAYDAEVAPYMAGFAGEALQDAAVPAGGHVLDVACGTGAFALGALRAGLRVTAVDFAPAMLARLRARAPASGRERLATHAMDGHDLRFPDATFDAACCMFGLLFYRDPARGVRELARVVRPGGRVVVSSWALGGSALFGALEEALAGRVPHGFAPPAGLVRLGTPEGMAGELRAAGLRDVRVRRVERPVEHASAAAAWASLRRVGPPGVEAVFDALGPEACRAVGREVVARLERRFGTGPVALPNAALLGCGVRAWA